MAIMALLINVDQSRVLMAVIAVIALLEVTPGAGSEVPISGVTGACLTGQATSLVHVSTGAGQSEPHGSSLAAAARRTPWS